jgi:hypothetical protein
MRFVMKVSIPVEKFNGAVRDGSAGKNGASQFGGEMP